MILINSSSGNNKVPFYWTLLSGCTAGCVAAVSVNPLDVIKTRLQAPAINSGRNYNGVVDCFRQILENEGYKAFLRGKSLLNPNPIMGGILFVHSVNDHS